jgi:hypothetical protein
MEEKIKEILDLLNGLSYEEILQITMEVRSIAREKSKLDIKKDPLP